MSLNPICKSSFYIKPLNENAYELNMLFSNQTEQLFNKTFTFLQQSFVQEGKILDVFTKNGICSSSLFENLFNKTDVKEAHNGATYLQSFPTPDLLVAVLDLKEPHTHY